MNRFALTLTCALIAGCAVKKKEVAETSTSIDSLTTKLMIYSLENNNGLKMTVTNYGGKIISLFVPDKNGTMGDVVLGYDSLKQYLNGNPYFGAMIGRCGNRIANGKFSLDGKDYRLATNNGANALHGGPKGFHNQFWEVEPFQTNDGFDALELRYKSVDGEEGYPGNLDVKVIYTLTDQNELMIDYEATTDKPTLVNLTHHSFFNLAGEGAGEVLNHELTIVADRFNPVDAGLIPTGMQPVAGGPFDFVKPHKIGERINQDDQQLSYGKGYDHNRILNKKTNEFSLAATVSEPTSGRVMEVWTTEPGLQFYSGNFLDGSDKGKSGKPYNFRSGFCLEAQHFPDSPNHKDFPPVVLRPGEMYKQKTVYKFSASK